MVRLFNWAVSLHHFAWSCAPNGPQLSPWKLLALVSKLRQRAGKHDLFKRCIKAQVNNSSASRVAKRSKVHAEEEGGKKEKHLLCTHTTHWLYSRSTAIISVQSSKTIPQARQSVHKKRCEEMHARINLRPVVSANKGHRCMWSGMDGKDASSWICRVTFPDLEFSSRPIWKLLQRIQRPGSSWLMLRDIPVLKEKKENCLRNQRMVFSVRFGQRQRLRSGSSAANADVRFPIRSGRGARGAKQAFIVRQTGALSCTLYVNNRVQVLANKFPTSSADF